MKNFLFASLILSSCGSSHKGGKEAASPLPPSNTGANVAVAPSPSRPSVVSESKRYHYRPAWLSSEWGKDEYFVSKQDTNSFIAGILPGEEAIADSLYRYWEGVRTHWNTSLHIGVIPDEYLARVPNGRDNIVWTDATVGKIGGFEKLKPVLDVIYQRCPSLKDPQFEAPLEIVWGTEKETQRAGQTFVNKFAINWSNEESREILSADTNIRPKLVVRAEYVKQNADGTTSGYTYPLQTLAEQTGGKSYSEGGSVNWSIDEDFAHEYGHFLMQSFAYRHGMSKAQSQWFSEGFAELFRTVCWGGLYDNPKSIDIRFNLVFGKWDDPFIRESHIKTYRDLDHRFSREGEYDLKSLGDYLIWTHKKGEFDSDKFFVGMMKTLEQMNGRIITDYPAISPIDGVLMDYAPWSVWSAFDRPEIKADPGVMFTRGEFLEKLCDNLKCDEAPKNLIDAEASRLKIDEF